MKRLFLLMLMLSLTSCSYIGITNDIIISAPSVQTSEVITEERTEITDTDLVPESDRIVGELILNTNSKKIHLYDQCSYANNIKEENKSVVSSEDREALLAEGYSICSWCEKQSEKN